MKRGRIVSAFALVGVLGCIISSASAVPVVDGMLVTQYATAANPFEIEFDSEGYLYAGNNSESGMVRIYKIAAEGGAAVEWGGGINDPDTVAIFGDHVYAAGHGDVFQISRATGTMVQWAHLPGNPNVSTGTIIHDDVSPYGDAGDMIIGNARFSGDIQVVDAVTQNVTTLVSSSTLYITRGLLLAEESLYTVESGTEGGAVAGIWNIAPTTGDLTRVDDGNFDWSEPVAMAYSSSEDNFYVGDQGLGQIVRVARTGGDATIVGWDADGISGLAFDDSGELYISDEHNDVIWRASPAPEPLLGDVNLDGEVNGLDVDPFVDVLLNGTDDNATRITADMNSDGEVNGLDVDPFVAAVIGGVRQIPEPSTLLLALVALGVIGGWRKWKRTA